MSGHQAHQFLKAGYLGNLNALRDWGYAKDYVECMWLILQHPYSSEVDA